MIIHAHHLDGNAVRILHSAPYAASCTLAAGLAGISPREPLGMSGRNTSHSAA